jgi:pilus assembly protein CpaC
MAQKSNGAAFRVAGLRRVEHLLLRALCGVAIALTSPMTARAQAPNTGGIRSSPRISIDADTAHMIDLGGPAKTVFVANPDIADIHVASPTNVLVYGKQPGTTTVFAIGEDGATTSYTIKVSRPIGDLISALRRAVPSARITVVAAKNGITLAGHVASSRDAEAVRTIGNQFLGDKETLNFDVVVDAAIQVTLRVQVAEVDRNITRALGMNWGAMITSGSISVGVLTGRAPIISGSFSRSSATNTFGSIGLAYSGNHGNTTVANLMDALDQKGLATILAEPTLTAVSGETATFLAGGQYPIPVPQGYQTVTVDYKNYGISLEFTPTVLAGDRISIKVRPEVSQLTTVGDLTLDGITVPALTVRRADTTVELGSGESFAIAGLFQNNGQNQVQNLPGLGDLPVLGPLFRSSSFQRNESELVIIVTPYLVRPVAQTADLHLPTEGFQYSSDIERILWDRLHAARPDATNVPTPSPSDPRLRGAAGFMME